MIGGRGRERLGHSQREDIKFHHWHPGCIFTRKFFLYNCHASKNTILFVHFRIIYYQRNCNKTLSMIIMNRHWICIQYYNAKTPQAGHFSHVYSRRTAGSGSATRGSPRGSFRSPWTGSPDSGSYSAARTQSDLKTGTGLVRAASWKP